MFLFTEALLKKVPSTKVAESMEDPIVWTCIWCDSCGTACYVAGYDPLDKLALGVIDGCNKISLSYSFLRETCGHCESGSRLKCDTSFVPRSVSQLLDDLGENESSDEA